MFPTNFITEFAFLNIWHATRRGGDILFSKIGMKVIKLGLIGGESRKFMLGILYFHDEVKGRSVI
jgi:hypothetical protein